MEVGYGILQACGCVVLYYINLLVIKLILLLDGEEGEVGRGRDCVIISTANIPWYWVFSFGLMGHGD